MNDEVFAYFSFHASMDGFSWAFPSVTYDVDADGFRLCDVTRGVPVLEVLSTNDSVTLNTTVLSAGTHYFIGNKPYVVSVVNTYLVCFL